jgi:hypothetical protein
MLHEFLNSNRAELIRRCRSKVGERSSPHVTPLELEHGVPRFLEQLVEELRYDETKPEPDFEDSSSKDQSGSVEGLRTATSDGDELFEQGYDVGQVVHGYGDICQVITTLAIEMHAPVTVREFRILNRLLDNAIAGAVSSFCRSESLASDQEAHDLHHQLGSLADEQRQLLDTALVALAAVKYGNVGLMGATGTLLEESLKNLRVLIDKSLPELRLATGMTAGAIPTPERRAAEPGRRLSDTRFATVRKLPR